MQTNRYGLSLFAIGLLLACCGQAAADNTEKRFGLSDYLCAISPVSCNSELYKRVYLAPPDAKYEITLNGKRLVILMGYLSDTQLLTDPRYPEKQDLYLVMLLPDLAPHSPQNLREFFTPYERSMMRMHLGIRGPRAIPWEEVMRKEQGVIRPETPVRRLNKFGLEGQGEDFDRWPKRRPCANLGHDEPPCGEPSTPADVWRPIKPNGPPSVMICDPDILDDGDARIVAMPAAEREAYFADPKQWGGRRRAMCDHRMLYEPLNARVEMIYPRRFIAQWKQTEDAVRRLLDGFIARGARNPQ